jgi:hypothetical protein
VSETCPRRDRWFRGCRFEPRYDLGGQSRSIQVNAITVDEMVALIDATKPKTYVRDVCVTCGRTVERGRP